MEFGSSGQRTLDPSNTLFSCGDLSDDFEEPESFDKEVCDPFDEDCALEDDEVDDGCDCWSLPFWLSCDLYVLRRVVWTAACV